MNFLTQKYLWLLCGGLTALMVAVVLIPLIIQLAKVKNLVDVPDHRKEHASPIPTLGGIAIFLGMFAAILIWLEHIKTYLMLIES